MRGIAAVARYSSCRDAGIDSVPWWWARNWVMSKIKDPGETIAQITSAAPENIIEVYRRIPQPHPFSNILFGSAEFPRHVLVHKTGVHDISRCRERFQHVIGWDSAIIFMEGEKRLRFWGEIERCIMPSGRITLAWTHFVNMTEEAVRFLNTEVFRCENHHFRGNFSPSDFKDTSRIREAISNIESNKEFLELVYKDVLADPDLLSIPYLKLIPPARYPEPKVAKRFLENVSLGSAALDVFLDAP